MAEVKFARLDDRERVLVMSIIDRWRAMLAMMRADVPDVLEVLMDLTAVHSHTPLKLQPLLDSDDVNFAHDLGGIRRYIDRTSGRLTQCFVPRFSK